MRYVIGDVHAEAKALEGLIAIIRERDSEAEFYFVGDFVDRGPDSKGVVDQIIAIGGQCVRGNHDDVMDLVANNENRSPQIRSHRNDAAEQTIWFMNFGMTDTLASYGVKADALTSLIDTYESVFRAPGVLWDKDAKNAALDDCMEIIRQSIPESHKQFFRNLPLIVENDDFFCGHAHVSTEATGSIAEWVNYSPGRTDDLIWGRFNPSELTASKQWGKIGYFGHTPTKHYGMQGKPILGNGVVLLDTGATFGDGLTAWCHETSDYFRVNKNGELIEIISAVKV